MRRIQAFTLMLGIAGLCGIGLIHGDIVTAQPDLKLPQVQPTTYSFSKKDGSSSTPAIPTPEPLEIPSAPSAPTTLAPLPQPKNDSPSLVLPVIDPNQPKTSASPIAPAGEPAIVLPDRPKPTLLQPRTVPKAPASELRFQSTHHPGSTLPGPVPLKTHAASGNRIVPCLSIETTGPDTVGHGLPVTYEILVRNVGQAAVTHVRVEEELPQGTKYISAEPAGEQAGGKILWMLGSMGPNDEKRIQVTVRPNPEGDLNTNPSLSYSTHTHMLVKVTRPTLSVTLTAPNAAKLEMRFQSKFR